MEWVGKWEIWFRGKSFLGVCFDSGRNLDVHLHAFAHRTTPSLALLFIIISLFSIYKLKAVLAKIRFHDSIARTRMFSEILHFIF